MNEVSVWDVIRNQAEKKKSLWASYQGSNKGGYLVRLEVPGVEKAVSAFLPKSFSRVGKVDLSDIMGTFSVKIVEVDEERNRVVVSARDHLKELNFEVRRQAVKKLERLMHDSVGDFRVQGTVRNLHDFGNFKGLFIDIGDGLDGLLTERDSDTPLEELAAEGKGITVTVEGVDVLRGRVRLSRKKKEKRKMPKVIFSGHEEEEAVFFSKLPAKKLKKALEDFLESGVSKNQLDVVLVQVKKRGDWLTRKILRGSYDWYSVLQTLLEKNKVHLEEV